jgi:hypothetical protein
MFKPHLEAIFVRQWVEINLEEAAKWEAALFDGKIFGNQEFGATLSLDSDPSLVFYCCLVVGPNGLTIDIPLEDEEADNMLRQPEYFDDTLAKLDKNQLHAFFTDWNKRSILMTYLNKISRNDPEIYDFFYSSFGLKHAESRGQFYISSYGGEETFTSIEYSRRIPDVKNPALAAATLVREAGKDLPHIKINPLSVNEYVHILQQRFGLLPQDQNS